MACISFWLSQANDRADILVCLCSWGVGRANCRESQGEIYSVLQLSLHMQICSDHTVNNSKS